MKLYCQVLANELRPTTKGDIVLIHGTGAKGDMWRNQYDRLLSLGYRCIIPDLRGHGQTGQPPTPTDLKAHIGDLLDTLEDLNIHKPTIFAGHSLGAIISMELAANHPQLCKMILPISLPGRVPRLTVETFKIAMNLPYERLRGTHLQKLLGWRERVLIDTERFTLEQVVENFQNIDFLQELPQPTCPVHLAVGLFDPVAPAHHVKSMHRLLPNSTLRIFPLAGHNCMDSSPKAFNKWFFDKLDC